MKVRALSEALIEGERSGPSQPFDFADLLARKHRTPTE
jgi:Arc/MetJ-type ribon-helix-helix transcriptional regulator